MFSPRFLLLFLMLPASLAPSAWAAASARDIRALTGAPTRVVWAQDTTEVPAVDAERPTLRLMGFDTEDGKGERPILATPARYRKPLLTADGTRVLYGDLGDNHVYVVNFDGTGRRVAVKDAHFEDVWTDPRDGVEWVYARVTEKRADKEIPVIRRFRLDNPEVSELVWDKMPIHMFTVSGDGRAASGGGDGGNSPQGLLTLPNGNFHARAGGCWPSIAPDASHRMWVFTGNHRSVHMCIPTNRTGNAYSHPVLFHPVPGLTLKGREEVHRLRWSNDTRFLVISSPFDQWNYRGEVKIPNEVAVGIEIYIGKFSDDLKTVEKWVPVTSNQRGDYWADVWVKPTTEQLKALADSVSSGASPTDETAAAPDQKGMVFVWETGAAGNQIEDPKTGAIRQCIGQFRDAARYARYHVMDLAGGAFVPEAADAPLLEGARATHQFAFEAVLTPPATPPAGEGVVFAFADDLETGNGVLSQKGEWLTLRLKTGDAKTLSPPVQLVRLAPGRANHVIVSYASGELAVYHDGRRVLLRHSFSGGLAGWTPQHLVFGDAWQGGRNWPGLLEGIGVFTRTITPGEARVRFARQAERRSTRTEAKRVVVEAKLIATCPPADPQGIAPYRRCLSVQQYEVTRVIEGTCDDKKIGVAQWSVLDGKLFPDYATYKPGQTYRLALERWSDRPEQESERMILGDFEEEGELFYQVREPAAPSATAGVAIPEAMKFLPAAGAPLRRIPAGPLVITGEKNPATFVNESGHAFDAQGRDLVFENDSLDEIAVTGAVRLDGGGDVTAATVLSGGFGYTEAPRVRISGGGGEGAAAEAVMRVSEISLTRLGSDYTSAPEVTISPPDVAGGRQAVAVAVVNKTNGSLDRITVRDPGGGYLSAPRVTLAGGGGQGAEAEVTLAVDDVFIASGGAGYTKPPAITFEGGGGEAAQAMAALQRTVLRYTGNSGNAMIANTGVIDQDGAALIYDWAAPDNGTGKRGYTNMGTWTLRNGAVIHALSSTNRPFRALSFGNDGTMRVGEGSHIGGADFKNTGNLQLDAGAVIGQLDYASGDGTLTNLGQLQVSGPADQPSLYGLPHPLRTGKRDVENGLADGSAKAAFTLGDGRDGAGFNVTGGQVRFTNHPGAVLKIMPGAGLSLLTNDAGSRHRFENREAKLLNSGDLLLAGRVSVRSNHSGFAGIENRGRFALGGAQVVIERLMASTGPGALYRPGINDTRILNAPGGLLFGSATLTYVNNTGSDGSSHMMVINLGTLAPGMNGPGLMTFRNVNVSIGGAPAENAAVQPGQLQIEIAGPPSAPDRFDRIDVSGEKNGGKFIIATGVGSVLDIVPAAGTTPRGTYRIVTAAAVEGTFDTLRLRGAPSTAYTVNYLPDALEVVFR